MDLGFAGLIEKIEEHFGKLITNLLLASLLILVFLWAMHQIFSVYVDGVTLWNEGGKSAIIGLVKIIFVLICLIFVTVIVWWAIVQRIKKRAIQKVKIELESLSKECISEIEKFGADGLKELRVLMAELKKVSGK